MSVALVGLGRGEGVEGLPACRDGRGSYITYACPKSNNLFFLLPPHSFSPAASAMFPTGLDPYAMFELSYGVLDTELADPATFPNLGTQAVLVPAPPINDFRAVSRVSYGLGALEPMLTHARLDRRGSESSLAHTLPAGYAPAVPPQAPMADSTSMVPRAARASRSQPFVSPDGRSGPGSVPDRLTSDGWQRYPQLAYSEIISPPQSSSYSTRLLHSAAHPPEYINPNYAAQGSFDSSPLFFTSPFSTNPFTMVMPPIHLYPPGPRIPLPAQAEPWHYQNPIPRRPALLPPVDSYLDECSSITVAGPILWPKPPGIQASDASSSPTSIHSLAAASSHTTTSPPRVQPTHRASYAEIVASRPAQSQSRSPEPIAREQRPRTAAVAASSQEAGQLATTHASPSGDLAGYPTPQSSQPSPSLSWEQSPRGGGTASIATAHVSPTGPLTAGSDARAQKPGGAKKGKRKAGAAKAADAPAKEKAEKGARACHMCLKSFDRPSSLRKHLLVHTREKRASRVRATRAFLSSIGPWQIVALTPFARFQRTSAGTANAASAWRRT